MDFPPVAIGGVGGSGTRLIASLLRDLGFYLGDDLNEPLDNLWFTFLFKRKRFWPLSQNRPSLEAALDIFLNAMSSRQKYSLNQKEFINSLSDEPMLHHSISWRQARTQSLLAAPELGGQGSTPWGWKEPNTHIFLPFLADEIPGLKYIHVMRHGLDMATSNNQHQLIHWGPQILGIRVERRNVRHSFDYWCDAHRRILGVGKEMNENFMLLNFDEFCDSPERELPKLLNFLGVTVDQNTESALRQQIHVPPSTGRRRWMNTATLPERQLAFLEELGFEVS
jgi:hypothetical protein